MSILSTAHLTKQYGQEPNIVKALDDVSISIEPGEFVAITGTSGSGKSTLLNMLGGLDWPSSGSYLLAEAASGAEEKEKETQPTYSAGDTVELNGQQYKVPDIMIVRIPKFRAVTSGAMAYDELFGAFQLWQEAHNDFFTPIIFDAPDFLCEKDGGLEWLWRLKDEITAADVTPYEIVEHPGGL